jgi:hypothetical protein
VISKCTFRIEMLPARHGDCILLSYGPAEDPAFVLIDGGPAASYAALVQRLYLLPRRQLELLVITHIDHDHIGGLIRLLGDRTLALAYKDLWFNGCDQLAGQLRGWSNPEPQTAGGERSALEGHHVALRIRQAGTRWNATFDGREVCLAPGSDPPEVHLAHGMKLTLLSPDIPALEELRISWRRALARLKLDPDDTRGVAKKLADDRRYRSAAGLDLSSGLVRDLAALGPLLDDSVANGSSIAFMAEYNGRRCAFLGDAHMPLVEASVRRLSRRLGEPRLRLDAVKISHHGSKGNTTASFLKLIECSRFLISTDGNLFGHPDDEAIARLLQHGGKPTQLYFNYYTEQTARWSSADLQRDLGYATHYPTTVPSAGVAVDLLD